jgi:hypothetical protein
MFNSLQVIANKWFKTLVIYDMMWHNDVANIILVI